MKPLLPAAYQPQVWVNDDAMDIEGRVEFDAAAAFFSQKPDRMLKIAKRILEGRHDIDELADGVSDHDSPFLVHVDRYDFVSFLAIHGVEPEADVLTEAELAGTKDADPSESMDLLQEHGIDVDDFPNVLSMSWDAYPDGGWYRNMAPFSVAEILSGETQSIFVNRSESGWDVRIGELHAPSRNHPSLSLAMRAGNLAIEKVDEDLPSVVAREFDLDPDAFEIEIVEEDTIVVTPKGEEHPYLVVAKNRVRMVSGEDEATEYREPNAVATALDQFKAAVSSAPAP